MTAREKIFLEISDKLEKIAADLNKMSIEVGKGNSYLGFRLTMKVRALQEVTEIYYALED